MVLSSFGESAPHVEEHQAIRRHLQARLENFEAGDHREATMILWMLGRAPKLTAHIRLYSDSVAWQEHLRADSGMHASGSRPARTVPEGAPANERFAR